MQADILKKIRTIGRKAQFPTEVKPMLCTLVKDPPGDPDYLYEVKWDGYRILSFLTKSSLKMGSRSGLDYTKKYPPVARALKALKLKAIFDGEVVVVNQEGKPDFDALQNYNGHETPIKYYIFDILYLEGYDLTHLPLTERKSILSEVIMVNEVLKYSDHFEDGITLYKEMQQLGLEGIVAKKANSIYRPGERSKSWLKIPTEIRQEFVIGGWVESDRGRPFASLLFGAYKGRDFEWIGHAGGGFKDAEMPLILAMLKKLETTKSPFANSVDANGIVHWVKPELVANFKFATWTKSGRIRKPAIFLGFRKDKKAREVVREIVEPLKDAIGDTVSPIAKKKSSTKIKSGTISVVNEDSNWPKLLTQKTTSLQDFDIEGCTIELSNVEREIWKGISKADLIQYYHSVAPYILPHIQDRPQSLHVKTINASSPGFYIKDMEGHQPECASIFTDKRKHRKPGKRDIIDYLVCNNEATLLYMINLGCVDVNPWTARISSPNEPDYIVIDLDPTDDDFKKVIETALAAKRYFAKYKLNSFIKTSGKTGMHLLLPCRDIDFKTARSLAEIICKGIHELVPSLTTTAVSISQRGKKLYIDPNQNDYADTIAAPYSARPFHTPSVSTPLEWREVNLALDPGDFTINNILARLKKKGDLFKDLLNPKFAINNMKVLKGLSQL